MSDDFRCKIESCKRAIYRGGPFLFRVFHDGKKHLSGKDCMELKNTYGMRIEYIMMLANSHGFWVDEEEFIKELEDEEVKMKNIKPFWNLFHEIEKMVAADEPLIVTKMSKESDVKYFGCRPGINEDLLGKASD